MNATQNTITDGFTLSGNSQKVEFTITADEANFSFIKISRNLSKPDTVEDCVYLGGQYYRNWFGGPERRNQYWPIQTLNFTDFPYVSKESENAAITERYWLSSEGVFVYVEPETPLFITQDQINCA
jgi:myogenesis-regulating glycosidase